MKTKITLTLIIASILLMVNAAKATTHTVQVANFSFTPNTLNIQSGDTVKWVWVSGNHTTTSLSVPVGASSWDSPMNSTSTQFEIQLTVPGTYNYNCTMHPTTMTGTITVAIASGLSDIGANSNSVNAYPSPFSDILSISFTIPETGATKISIYDITGKQIKVLVDMNYQTGNYIICWDGRNENGEIVDPGIYFYMIENKGVLKTSGKIVFGA
jgi:plastocyanin